MAKPKPEKRERDGAGGGQLPLPTPQPQAPPASTRLLPIQLQLGDHLVDETGEWEVVGHPGVKPSPKDLRTPAHVSCVRACVPSCCTIG